MSQYRFSNGKSVFRATQILYNDIGYIVSYSMMMTSETVYCSCCLLFTYSMICSQAVRQFPWNITRCDSSIISVLVPGERPRQNTTWNMNMP